MNYLFVLIFTERQNYYSGAETELYFEKKIKQIKSTN